MNGQETNREVFVGDIRTDSGKTIKEENLEKVHGIPIDTLVEVKFDQWIGNGACKVVWARLWVVEHTRDCDGTPLYILAEKKSEDYKRAKEEGNNLVAMLFTGAETGFAEGNLVVVKVTPELKEGEGALSINDLG